MISLHNGDPPSRMIDGMRCVQMVVTEDGVDPF